MKVETKNRFEPNPNWVHCCQNCGQLRSSHIFAGDACPVVKGPAEPVVHERDLWLEPSKWRERGRVVQAGLLIYVKGRENHKPNPLYPDLSSTYSTLYAWSATEPLPAKLPQSDHTTTNGQKVSAQEAVAAAADPSAKRDMEALRKGVSDEIAKRFDPFSKDNFTVRRGGLDGGQPVEGASSGPLGKTFTPPSGNGQSKWPGGKW